MYFVFFMTVKQNVFRFCFIELMRKIIIKNISRLYLVMNSIANLSLKFYFNIKFIREKINMTKKTIFNNNHS